MTGQHRKPELREGGPVPGPGTFLVRPVDADRVREAISGVVADAINRAAETVRKIREWCDDADQIVCSHQSEHECIRCDAVKDCAAAVRTLLPDVPSEGEGVDMGTRVTRGDREYPGGGSTGNRGDDNHWRNRGGTDSGN